MKKCLTKTGNKPSYSILDPVVDLLLANGNTLATHFRWGSNPTGYFCKMAEPVDFDLIESTFDLPSEVQLLKDLDQVDYGLGTAVIVGPAT